MTLDLPSEFEVDKKRLQIYWGNWRGLKVGLRELRQSSKFFLQSKQRKTKQILCVLRASAAHVLTSFHCRQRFKKINLACKIIIKMNKKTAIKYVALRHEYHIMKSHIVI